jgi:Tol biopolymer transport system component
MEELLWMDSRGEVIASATGPAEPSGFALSPDGAAVVVARRSEGVEASELWILDLARRAPMRLTFDNRDAENPLWAPDGRRIVFTSRGESETEIRSIAPNAAKSETLLRSPSGVILDSWSPDSRFLAYTTSQKGKLGLWVLHLEDDRKAMLFLNGEFNYRQGRFSPDGRFMAYVSDESGRDEVYLRSFPSGEVRVLVSVDGGMQPLWRRDGRALVYLSPDQQLKSVDIERSGDRPTPGIPRPMFKMPRAASKYAMTNDGRRFLVALPVQEQERSPIHLVLNWVIITGSDYSNPKF